MFQPLAQCDEHDSAEYLDVVPDLEQLATQDNSSDTINLARLKVLYKAYLILASNYRYTLYRTTGTTLYRVPCIL